MSKLVRNIRFLVTPACNYHCLPCHNESMDRNDRTVNLTDDLMMELVESVEGNLGDLILSGGEPWARKGLVELLGKFPKNHRIRIVTNGSMITEEDLDRIAEYEKQRAAEYPIKLVTSLCTLDPEKYKEYTKCPHSKDRDLEHIIDVLRLSDNKGIPGRINAVLFKGVNEDYDSYKALIDFAAEYHRDISFIELFETDSEEHNKVIRAHFEPVSTIQGYIERDGFEKTGQSVWGFTFYKGPNGITVATQTYPCVDPEKEAKFCPDCMKTSDVVFTPRAEIKLFCRGKTYPLERFKEIFFEGYPEE